MKTTQRNFKVVTPARLSRWTVFAAALVSMFALVAVMTDRPDGRLVKPPPPANEAWRYYANAGNADMSVIFQAR